jgi:tetratricopeptide (TPR) repeat protein
MLALLEVNMERMEIEENPTGSNADMLFKAIERDAVAGITAGSAERLQNLGVAMFRAGQYTRARAAAVKAAELNRKSTGNKLYLTTNEQLIAGVDFMLGNYAVAEKEAFQAIDRARRQMQVSVFFDSALVFIGCRLQKEDYDFVIRYGEALVKLAADINYTFEDLKKMPLPTWIETARRTGRVKDPVSLSVTDWKHLATEMSGVGRPRY